jgi:hypothetical protein
MGLVLDSSVLIVAEREANADLFWQTAALPWSECGSATVNIAAENDAPGDYVGPKGEYESSPVRPAGVH